MSKLQLVAHRQLVRLDLKQSLISMGNGYEFKIFAEDSTQGHEKYRGNALSLAPHHRPKSPNFCAKDLKLFRFPNKLSELMMSLST